MSEEVKNFIDKISQNDMTAAGDAFKDALRSKVGDDLDVKRQEVASNLFTAEPHSDPKPEIAGTGTFTQDGQVEPTGANAVETPGQEATIEAEPVSPEQPDVQQ
jgi:hypothetical protein